VPVRDLSDLVLLLLTASLFIRAARNSYVEYSIEYQIENSHQ